MSVIRQLCHSRKPGKYFIDNKYFICKRFIMSDNMLQNKNIVSFEDVKAAKDNKNILVVDVREPSELQETGVIPGSINVPLGEVESAFKNISPEEFQKKYGIPKPESSKTLIFSCKLGKRAASAHEIVAKLGYPNCRTYGGSWVDWAEKINQQK